MLAGGLLRGHRHSRPRPERGAVAVEFALVLPILVMLLLGIATTGLSYTHAIGVTNAVREGARFGATASATNGATWASDTISRVRGTQFDDPASETAVCVQLWKVGTGQVGTAGSCSQGTETPALSLPSSATDRPAIPAGVPTGTCVVRVLAGRNFSINIAIVPVWNRVSVSSSVARYERMDLVSTCG